MTEKQSRWHVCSGSYVDRDPFARESRWRPAGASKGGRPRKKPPGKPQAATQRHGKDSK